MRQSIQALTRNADAVTASYFHTTVMLRQQPSSAITALVAAKPFLTMSNVLSIACELVLRTLLMDPAV